MARSRPALWPEKQLGERVAISREICGRPDWRVSVVMPEGTWAADPWESCVQGDRRGGEGARQVQSMNGNRLQRREAGGRGVGRVSVVHKFVFRRYGV